MHTLSDFLSSLLAAPEGALSWSQVLGAVGMAYLGGILASLTPCVYPMIPITIGVVGGGPVQRAGGADRSAHPWREVLWRGSAYVFGMTVIYSFLGVAAGLTGRVFGSFTNTSSWYLGLGIVISLSALIMMEVIPFDPAAAWQRLRHRFGAPRGPVAVGGDGTKRTLAGAFALGASSGFIAAPCTTPVLTSILAYIAKTQSVAVGLALMVSFSLGLGTLLLLIATFTGALQILPRSGAWMRTIKILSGLLLLGFGHYLVYRAGALGG